MHQVEGIRADKAGVDARQHDTGRPSWAWWVLGSLVILTTFCLHRGDSKTAHREPREQFSVGKPTLRGVSSVVGLLLVLVAVTIFIEFVVPKAAYDYLTVVAAAVLAGLIYLAVVDDVPLNARIARSVAYGANALWIATLIAPAIDASSDLDDNSWQHLWLVAIVGILKRPRFSAVPIRGAALG
jgi:hypothetical protein